MALLREAPKCPKCGEQIEGRYRNQSDLPQMMRLIGDTFIEWDWKGHKCKKKQRDAELHNYAVELGIDEQNEKAILEMADRAIKSADDDKKYVKGLESELTLLKEENERLKGELLRVRGELRYITSGK